MFRPRAETLIAGDHPRIFSLLVCGTTIRFKHPVNNLKKKKNDDVTERARLVAAFAMQLSERCISGPVAVNRIGCNMQECALLLGRAALQHSSDRKSVV